MKTIRELRERMGELVLEVDAINADAEKRNEALTEDELSRIDELMAEHKRCERTIEIKENQRRLHSAQTDDKPLAGEQKELRSIRRDFSLGRMLAHLVNPRAYPLDGLEGEMHQEAEREMRGLGHSLTGIGIPSTLFTPNADLAQAQYRDAYARMNLMRRSDAQTATMQTTNPGDEGGVTVATQVQQIVEALWPRMVLRALGARFLTGLTSNQRFPIETQTVESTFKDEIEALDQSQKLFSPTDLTPHRMGTYVEVSKQLIIQSVQTPSITQFIIDNIRMSIASKLEQVVINGDGVKEPTGLLGTTGIGNHTAASPDWGDVIELETIVAAANGDRGALGYLTTPQMRGALKQSAVDSGSGLFVWYPIGMTADYPGNGEGVINGYPAYTSNNVPSNLGTGTNENAIIFGNWNDLVVAQWGGLDITINPYIKDINGIVRVTVQSFWDSAVLRPQSFAAIKNAVVS